MLALFSVSVVGRGVAKATFATSDVPKVAFATRPLDIGRGKGHLQPQRDPPAKHDTFALSSK
ncbi:hypothetical protein B1H26_09545 [Amycolatopsis sp. BJA-103]|nr:hypothetical protein BKN51_22940 [Amycolatopsis sp. BJA-103]PNE21961.1 hypothetical protein B1H26_09545 [Amycolatopsis sp. BJA-103]